MIDQRFGFVGSEAFLTTVERSQWCVDPVELFLVYIDLGYVIKRAKFNVDRSKGFDFVEFGKMRVSIGKCGPH